MSYICTFYFIQQTLYDQKKRKGVLYNKLFYQKYGPPATRKNKKRNNKNNKNHDNSLSRNDTSQFDEDLNRSIAELNHLTLNEELENLLFFKTCIVSRNRDVLELKMKNTIALREKAIKKHETKFVEIFPFYFVEPELVSS